jgi:phage-related baseplate assembly protein
MLPVSGTATSSSGVDLSRLPPPTIVEALTFETILADLIARVQEIMPGFDATVDSDPAVKILQLWAYRELLLRQMVDDAGRQLLTAYAMGANLDHLASLVGVARLVLDPGDEEQGIAPTLESDADLRQRIVLAAESFSCAGPELAYIFHAKSAHPDVLDASATSPEPGEVLVSLLSRTGDGTAPPATIDAVAAVLSPVVGNRIRPMGDVVTVASAEIIEFAIVAILYTFAGPDRTLVLEAARARLDAYLAESRKLGRNINDSSIKAALTVAGVQRVVLPGWADIICDPTQAAWCTGIDITHGGYDD